MSDGGVINKKRQRNHEVSIVVSLLLATGNILIQMYYLRQERQVNCLHKKRKLLLQRPLTVKFGPTLRSSLTYYSHILSLDYVLCHHWQNHPCTKKRDYQVIPNMK